MKSKSGPFLVTSLILGSCSENSQPNPIPVSINNSTERDARLATRAWNMAQMKLHRADDSLALFPRSTRERLKRYFGSDSNRVRERVSRVIRKMRDRSSQVRYTIRIEESANMPEHIQRAIFENTGCVSGFTLKDGAPVLFINRQFLRANPNGIHSVLLHELSHNAANTEDIGYFRGGGYRLSSGIVELNETQLLNNADTYSEFIDRF